MIIMSIDKDTTLYQQIYICKKTGR